MGDYQPPSGSVKTMTRAWPMCNKQIREQRNDLQAIRQLKEGREVQVENDRGRKNERGAQCRIVFVLNRQSVPEYVPRQLGGKVVRGTAFLRASGVGHRAASQSHSESSAVMMPLGTRIRGWRRLSEEDFA